MKEDLLFQDQVFMDPRSPLRKTHLSSPVRPRSRAVLIRRGKKSALVRPLVMAAQISDDSVGLLEQAIMCAREERQSFPYVVMDKLLVLRQII